MEEAEGKEVAVADGAAAARNVAVNERELVALMFTL
jgi:hypothetical protein